MRHSGFHPTIYMAILWMLAMTILLSGCSGDRVKETDEQTLGIDVARYQGTIDWKQVADSGVDFAMIRVGYRSNADGEIKADTNARYNLQEAQKYGIPVGVYFFSTAVSDEEAEEEAEWVAEFVGQYSVTYPVAYDCEGFNDADSRQLHLSKRQRTGIALTFLETIEELGYSGMFYGSKNDLAEDAQWLTSRIEGKYKIWVAQYPQMPYPDTEHSTYDGTHHMWQYSAEGSVAGITQPVDLNVSYFGYDGIREPKNNEPPEPAEPDIEALMDFREVNEIVTAKEKTNLRNMPSQDEECKVMYTLVNGELATRIAVSNTGWSKVVFNGETYYALTNYLTTDMNYIPIKTQFEEVNEKVTAKEYVNLRNIPSTTHEKSVVVTQLHNGEVAIRTGINTDVGWSRVEYNGQVLYCVSSHLQVLGD